MSNKYRKFFTLIGIVFISLLAACNNSTVIETKENNPISIETENPVVDITKPEEITTDNNETAVSSDNNKNTNLIINEDMSYNEVHPLGTYAVEGIIKNKYVQISTITEEMWNHQRLI